MIVAPTVSAGAKVNVTGDAIVAYGAAVHVTLVGNTYARDVRTAVSLATSGPWTPEGPIVRAYT